MLKRLTGVAAALAVALMLLPAGGAAGGRFDRKVARDLSFARAQLKRTLHETRPRRFPQETRRNGRWRSYPAQGWTSGFFPGTLWLMYDATHARRWRIAAKRRQHWLERQKRNRATHDLGLMLFDSFGQGYRLTRNDHFRRVVITAARSLATRYSRRVRAIRSWNNRGRGRRTDFRVIVDSMMNLELLFWASKHGGGHGLAKKALAHARTVARTHVRPDGSTFHLVVFNSRTGAVRRKRTVQGYSDSSAWARGQAWAIYGFTTAYRYTHRRRMLAAARRVADYYITHLPLDGVPYWDFRAPGIPHAPRDSSAAAIAASGLLQLGRLDPSLFRRRLYLLTARATLRSLSSRRYLAKHTRNRAILRHGTADKPRGHFNRGLIYGDYFFLEALLRYRALPRPVIPRLPPVPPLVPLPRIHPER